ncbi:hypothetical protein Poly24_20190 [Rosistilla carotiformis]|uniref:Uncharacterized protein n=1 Tax=Rosistilla carotiformis TaxID=2528017 RepID=A0A518JS02_9BACT|nr:hypothetical protein Poly24_20190 [Rosistilla carotiformis]
MVFVPDLGGSGRGSTENASRLAGPILIETSQILQLWDAIGVKA